MTADSRIDRADALLRARRQAAALDLYDAVLADRPDDVAAWRGRGRALNNLGRLAAAERAFRRTVELAPGDAQNHNLLGHVRRARGDPAGAATAFRSAIAADDGFAVAHYNLGTVLALAGDYAAAARALERSLELGRIERDALLNLGELYQFLERFAAAAEAYRRALQLDPRDAAVHALLGDLWYSLGEVEKALPAYDAALACDPRNTQALAGRALLCELWGDIDAGLALLDERADDAPALDYARARLLRRSGAVEAALKILQRLAANPATAADPRVHFTLGEVCDELGRYAEAAAAFRRANGMKPAPFDPAAHARAVAALIAFFDTRRFAALARATPAASVPVFIVGMPRSGTSLVEQILASHPAVHAGGERLGIPEIVHRLGEPYPDCLASVDGERLNALAARYRAGYGAIGAAAVWTDKLPKNFLHLGLIALLFPNARVVYCRRDRRDTGLSVYFQNMNFRSDPWTARLEHIAAYTAECERIMTHWQQVLPLPLHTVEYAALVENAEQRIRALLDFLDLPWDPRCLEFHRTRRLVNTASYAQVRRPLYRSSIGRWRNYPALAGILDAGDADRS